MAVQLSYGGSAELWIKRLTLMMPRFSYSPPLSTVFLDLICSLKASNMGSLSAPLPQLPVFQSLCILLSLTIACKEKQARKWGQVVLKPILEKDLQETLGPKEPHLSAIILSKMDSFAVNCK